MDQLVPWGLADRDHQVLHFRQGSQLFHENPLDLVDLEDRVLLEVQAFRHDQ